MTDLSSFPITKKWPAQHPDRIQLYSLPTPNGVKVSIMLEETGLPYEPHLVSFETNDQMSPEFISLSANNKIPAILDPNGPGGKPLALFESGAILVYLAAKSGRFMPKNDAARYETLQWLMFQMGGIGPMFGQLGFSTSSPAKTMKTSARATAMRPSRNACWGCWTSDLQTASGSWEMTTPLPTWPSSHGCAIWSGFMARASWWSSARLHM